MAANPNAGARMFYTRKSDGRTYEFCPVPLLAESIEYNNKENLETGSRLSTTTRLSFNGYLLPENPSLSGINPSASCFEILDRKSDQLKYALNEHRGNLLIIDASGYVAYNVYPIISSLSFDEGQMVNHRKYSLEFEYENDYGTDKVKSYTENWSIQPNDDDTFAISHAVNAVGIPDIPAGTGALQNAQRFVLAKLNNVNKPLFPANSYPNIPALLNINNFSAYNHTKQEESSETAGSYNVTENWILASGQYKDDRTIQIDYTLDETNTQLITVSINGTVAGYGDTTFEKFSRAYAGFYNDVAPALDFFATSGYTNKNISQNRFAGTVSYSLSVVPSTSNQIENQSISRSFQFNEDGTVTQTVSTTAKVRNGSSEPLSTAEAFCFANCYPIDSITPPFSASLSGNIESVSKQLDELSKSCSLTRVFRDQSTLDWREEYEVNRDESIDGNTINITVNGTVFGLKSEPSTKSMARFVAASGAYFNTVEPLIYQRAQRIVPTGTCISQKPTKKTLGMSELAGRITYSWSFENRPTTSNDSIKTEKIQVSYKLPTDVFASFQIPGKASGPVLQDQQTVTGRSKSITITFTMNKNTIDQCGNYAVADREDLEAIAISESNIIVNNTRLANSRGERPIASNVFKSQDEYSFSDDYVFTRNVTWEYTG